MIKEFSDLMIKPELSKALFEMGFSVPTPVQSEVIPIMLNGQDCFAKAPTGSGKTCAFAIPILNEVDVTGDDVQTLILCPTRELARQTEMELRKVAKHLVGCKILAIYGGQHIERQLQGLRKRPHIVVGTPGRIMDHLRKKTLKLKGLKTLVLDEADEMLNMGFRGDIDTILDSCAKMRQTVLFSATMSKEILQITKSYQTDPVTVETDTMEENVPKITQYFVSISEDKKMDMLISLMEEKKYSLVLVFCNTKIKTDQLSKNLRALNIKAEALHGDLQQRIRDVIMRKFRSNEINVLVATDVAARGIDVSGIEAVFNYDIPIDNEYYVHRIGRTGRAGKEGESYAFFSSRDLNRKKVLEKITDSRMIPLIKEQENDTGEKKRDFKKSQKPPYQNRGKNPRDDRKPGDKPREYSRPSGNTSEFKKSDSKPREYRNSEGTLIEPSKTREFKKSSEYLKPKGSPSEFKKPDGNPFEFKKSGGKPFEHRKSKNNGIERKTETGNPQGQKAQRHEKKWSGKPKGKPF